MSTPMEFSSALCSQTDPEIFFPEKGGSNKTAKKICAKCVHEWDCLQDALSNSEEEGIRGGKSKAERRRMLDTRSVA